MLFSEKQRYQYEKNQLIEVVCQLRFPVILSITGKQPIDFQDAVRAVFPKFSVMEERPAPKVTGLNTAAPKIEPQDSIKNYCFISADAKWKLNLTNGFIALSTTAYPSWEQFAAKFDRPLASFIEIYKPSYFERIGLRYVNAFSRKNLGIESMPWRDLIEESYLGILADVDVNPNQVEKSAVDVECKLGNSCKLKLHAGPGLVKVNGTIVNQETRFIFDQDLSMSGNIQVSHAVGSLNTLHYQATNVFQGAIKDPLHEAMRPIS